MTADGEVKIANACSNPDLFWALKGGGGGFGVVTRVTLRTHALPEFLGGVFATIKATSDDAYRRLIAKIVEFYAEALFNPHWGEADPHRARLRRDFDGLPGPRLSNRRRRPGVRSSIGSRLPRRISAIVSAPRIISEPARRFWDPAFLKHSSRPRHLGRSSRRAGGQYFLGRQPRRGGRGLVRLPIRLAARFAARRPISGKASPTRFSRPPSIAASRCIATRASRARPRKRSPRRRIRR